MTNEPFCVDDFAEMPPPNPYLVADHPRAGACGSSPPNPYALTVAELERYYDRDTLELQIRFCKATGRHAQLAVFLEALELQQLLIAAEATGDPHAYLPDYREVYEEYCRLRVLDAQRPRKQEPGARATGRRTNQRGGRETAKGRNCARPEPHLSDAAFAGFLSLKARIDQECYPSGLAGTENAAPCRPLGRPQIAGGGSHRETAPKDIQSPVRGDRVGVVPPVTGLEAVPDNPSAHAGCLRAPQGAQQGTVPAIGDLIPRPGELLLTGNDGDSPSAQTTAPGTVPLRLVGRSKIGNLKSKIELRPLRSRFGLTTGSGGACLRIAA